MNTRISQQVGASFGTAIVAVALQTLLSQGADVAFRWAIGITLVVVIPALTLPAAWYLRPRNENGSVGEMQGRRHSSG
jgi:hypothetical protein